MLLPRACPTSSCVDFIVAFGARVVHHARWATCADSIESGAAALVPGAVAFNIMAARHLVIRNRRRPPLRLSSLATGIAAHAMLDMFPYSV